MRRRAGISRAVYPRLGLRTLGVGALMLVAAFLVTEGLLRLYFAVIPGPSESSYVGDAVCGYRLRPDPLAVRVEHPDDHINTLGFRDREHELAKPRGTYRVLGIGDSFVYGNVPLEDNFLRVAEECLSQHLASDSLQAEVILMGLGGYSPENELGVLRGHGLELSPDLVILNFFVGNDVTGLPVRGVVCHGQLYYAGCSIPWLHALRQSRIFMLAETVWLTRLKEGFVRERLEEPAGTAEASASAAEPAMDSARIPVSPAYLSIESRRLPVFLRETPRRVDRLWQRVETILVEFDGCCAEAGVPWVLHVIPSEVQVDQDVCDQVLDGLGLCPDHYDFDAPQRRLRAIAEAHGILIHDPLPMLRGLHAGGDRLYIPNDTHWNVGGNRAAGEALADAVAAFGTW